MGGEAGSFCGSRWASYNATQSCCQNKLPVHSRNPVLSILLAFQGYHAMQLAIFPVLKKAHASHPKCVHAGTIVLDTLASYIDQQQRWCKEVIFSNVNVVLRPCK